MAGDDDQPDGPGRTVYQPPPGTGASSLPPANTTRRIEAPSTPTAPPKDGRLAIGAVLNHIYEVRRFIDRGGMGEVYEGINVNTDERVAIKVILPHLAADPNVQAMFRKEARTLTRLNHPALVQYRVLAQEPQLGALYIVTEFVDGIGLDLMIGHMTPSEDQVRSLMRRLADGLRAAHELGAIHRDISPDNILAPEGSLDQAKIIDFGIAKDLQTSQATIVGAGFAGKLGFVAPEQFGDFDRQIGPWTDIYSLGLVMLAFATGEMPDMGTNLVEAVDRRRVGPDLSKVSATLKPVLAGMLAADPQKRFRSMDEVIAALDRRPRARSASKPPATGGAAGPAAEARAARAKSAPPKARSTPPPNVRAKSELKLPQPPSGIPRQALLYAGAAFVGVLVLGLGAMWLIPKKPGTAVASDVAATAGPISGAMAPPRGDLTQTLETAVNSARCAWLEYDTGGSAAAMTLTLTGAAADPANATGSVGAALGDRPFNMNPQGVQEVSEMACGAIDSLRQVRMPTSGGRFWITAQQAHLHPDAHSECHNDPAFGLAVIEGALGGPGEDSAMWVLAPDGQLRSVFNNGAGLDALVGGRSGFPGVASRSGDGFRVSLCESMPGVYGVALVRGPAGKSINMGLPSAGSDDTSPTPANFGRDFVRTAKQQNWRTQMVWFVVDRRAAPVIAVQPAPITPPPPPPPRGSSRAQHAGQAHGAKNAKCGHAVNLQGMVPGCGPAPAVHHDPPPPPPPPPPVWGDPLGHR